MTKFELTGDDSRAAALPRSPEMMRAADTALLVVDVQQRLVPAIRNAERIVWNCRRLLDGARVLGLRSAITEQNPEKLGGTVAELAAAYSDAVPAKMAFSCGACGELFADWRDVGIERVLVCGIETHVCGANGVRSVSRRVSSLRRGGCCRLACGGRPRNRAAAVRNKWRGANNSRGGALRMV